MSFFQLIRRLNDVAWSQSDAILTAETAPSLGTHGTALTKGSGLIQYGTSDLTAVTDYAIRLYVYVNSQWMCIEEHTACGAVPRVWETAIGALATRWKVDVSAIAGTSLKTNYRQV